jgi:hypothetical protein
MKKFIETALIMLQQNGSCIAPKGIVCSECMLDYHRECTVFVKHRIGVLRQHLRECVESGDITEEEIFELCL